MALPLVAVVGRPNVGKSTLFNRICGGRAAVVHEESGVTRDRHIRPAEWSGRHFTLADTGGIVPFEEGAPFEQRISEVARHTVEMADAVLFLVDAKVGITAHDEALARELRRVRKQVHVVANKADKDAERLAAADFYRLGLGEPHAVSALHGRGVGDLLDALIADLPLGRPEPEADLRIALVGRPNVGKSSLVNTLTGQEASLVSDVPGTTRDAVDTRLRWQGRSLLLVDTAGIRRRFKHEKGVEYFSVLRSIQAIQRCDVAVLLLDATEGIVAQDARVAGEIHDAGRGVVIAVNKWDAIEKDTMTYKRFEEEVRDDLAFLSYAPVVTISARERTRTGRILELAWEVGATRQKTVETSTLNDIIEAAKRRNPPPMYNRGTGKIYYGTQTGTAPPTFTLFVNRTAYFPRHYLRYLNNRIREAVGYSGTRIRLVLKDKKRE
jgi:GTP-binding protein